MFWRKKTEEQDKQTNKIEHTEPTSFADLKPEVIEQPEPSAQPENTEPQQKKSLFNKLRDGLKATRHSITQRAYEIFNLRGKIDEDFLEELEEVLISADVGVDTTLALIDELRNRIRLEKKQNSDDSEWLINTLQELMRNMFEQGDRSLRTAEEGPTIYLIIGVNGVGKTTAIGKLAHQLKNEGKSVLMVAADTFRAAAIEQLEIWANRAGVPIVKGKEKSDPSSVVYNAMQEARKTKVDTVIIDTAGRLHTKSNLMQELAKMNRVIGREFEGAPHETLLVLDASTGQNSLEQAKKFLEAVGVSGLILTKLDGTAKGGVILSLHQQLQIPVKFIGVGEKIDDLEPFDADTFCKALFRTEVEQKTA